MSREGEAVLLTITDLSRGGAGVGRLEGAEEGGGIVVFVPGTAPGDRVRARILEWKKRYAQGELLEVIERSPMRVEPPCPVFGICGGCAWQHIPYAEQWKTKARGVLHALERTGVRPAAPADEIPAERVWEYRNRVQVRGEGGKMGFFARGSQKLVAVDRCEIARPEINAAWTRVREEGARLKRPFKAEIEVSEDGRVTVSWNRRHAAQGFRQVHDEQNEKLREWVGRAVRKGDRVLDLFGGAGNLSLPLLDRASRVDSVDRFAPPGPPRAGFFSHREDVEAWLAGKAAEARDERPLAEVAFLDPPREGLSDSFHAIEGALRKLRVRALVGVGCDPDAWARDLKRFLDRGWALRRWGILDLFPQTPHVESLFEVYSPEFLT